MHVREVSLPDGRTCLLYSFDDTEAAGTHRQIVPPAGGGPTGELRWDARRGEWVAVAPHRQDRTFHPPPTACPFCPTRAGAAATEVPAERFDLAVFENRFPSLRGDAIADAGDLDSAREPALLARRPATGRTEIVVYSPDHDATLATLPAAQLERLLLVWSDRYGALGAEPGIAYVLLFENRGEEIGVTLTHPHGQIYAYPELPPNARVELQREREHLRVTGACLHCDLLRAERAARVRVFGEWDGCTAYVPFAARWPFELHVVMNEHRPSLLDVTAAERADLAVALGACARAFDALFQRPMPYIMAVRQAATPAHRDAAAHLRVELYGARRARDRLKHRAGSETSSGLFINDVAPEDAAAMLRQALAAADRLVREPG